MYVVHTRLNEPIKFATTNLPQMSRNKVDRNHFGAIHCVTTVPLFFVLKSSIKDIKGEFGNKFLLLYLTLYALHT